MKKRTKAILFAVVMLVALLCFLLLKQQSNQPSGTNIKSESTSNAKITNETVSATPQNNANPEPVNSSSQNTQAESGLLDHHVATTTWWLALLFHQRYPKVRLEASRMVVASGRVLTAGARPEPFRSRAMAGEAGELRTWRPSPRVISSSIPARAQSAYVITDHLAHDDPLVTKFERWSRARMRDGFSLDEASHALATSKRTLARHIGDALGKTPLAYFQDLRVEQAVHMLKNEQRLRRRNRRGRRLCRGRDVARSSSPPPRPRHSRNQRHRIAPSPPAAERERQLPN